LDEGNATWDVINMKKKKGGNTLHVHVCQEGSKVEGEGRGWAERGWYGLGALEPHGSGFRKSVVFGVAKGGFRRLL